MQIRISVLVVQIVVQKTLILVSLAPISISNNQIVVSRVKIMNGQQMDGQTDFFMLASLLLLKFIHEALKRYR